MACFANRSGRIKKTILRVRVATHLNSELATTLICSHGMEDAEINQSPMRNGKKKVKIEVVTLFRAGACTLRRAGGHNPLAPARLSVHLHT